MVFSRGFHIHSDMQHISPKPGQIQQKTQASLQWAHLGTGEIFLCFTAQYLRTRINRILELLLSPAASPYLDTVNQKPGKLGFTKYSPVVTFYVLTVSIFIFHR